MSTQLGRSHVCLLYVCNSLKRSCHLDAQDTNWSTSNCRASLSLAMFDSSLYSLVSSCRRHVRWHVIDVNYNRIRPRIVPWGTLDVTQGQDEWVPQTTMRCLRSVKKLLNQRSNEPSIPWHFNLSNSRSWGTESNAFDKSKNLTSVGLDFFLDDAQSSKQHSNWDRVDCPSRKPNWFGLRTFRACQKWTRRF